MTGTRTRWLILALFTLALTSPPGRAGATAPERGVYLALGDSLARGVGATNPDLLGYVPRLSHFFRGSAHGGIDTLTNLGVRGETSATFISSGQLAGAVNAISDPATDIRVVTLDIGGNDLLMLLAPSSPCLTDPAGVPCQGLLASALGTFATNYGTILAALRGALEGDPGAEPLLVMTYYNHLSGTGHPLERTLDRALLGADLKLDCPAAAVDARNLGLNDIIYCVGIQYEAVVVDVYPAFFGKGPSLTHVQEGGDFHPTNAGYAIIANTFMRALRPRSAHRRPTRPRDHSVVPPPTSANGEQAVSPGAARRA